MIDTGFAPAPAGDATRVMSAPPAPVGIGYGEATQQAITITCPVCSTPNGPAERYCQDCGLLMGSTPAEIEPLPDASQLPRLVNPATGQELLLNPGLNTVGRDSADVLLPDPTVSRRHAQVTLEEGQLVVEDLGSTNGTQVAGNPVRPGDRAVAFSGDTVRFGSITLTLTLPGGAARAEAAPDAAAAAPAERGAALGYVAAPDGPEFPLYAGVNTVGRRSGNQIVYADSFMSGKHGEFHVEEDGSARYVDVGSTNGSFLAGERLAPNVPVALNDGTELTLGKTRFLFRRAAPGAPEGAVDAAPEEPPAADVTAFVLPDLGTTEPPAAS